jgi:stage II sporulation protein D
MEGQKVIKVMHNNQMLRSIITFMIFMGLAGYGFAYNEKQALEEADRYLRNGQYLESVETYQDISDLSSDSEVKAGAYLRMGDIYNLFLNNHDLALEKYTVVIKKYGKSTHTANAYFNSGMILYENYRYEEAINQFKAYLKRFPRGERKKMAEFMIETCSRSSLAIKEKKQSYKTARDEIIRVLIMTGVRDIRVDSPSLFEVRDGNGKDVLSKASTATMRFSGGGIKVNGSQMSHERLVIVPSYGSMLILKDDHYGSEYKLQRSTGDKLVIISSDINMMNMRGEPYRGKIRLHKNAGRGIDVINVLNVEDYLYGVVPKEMPPQWHPEALKAQAIAARTYALYQKEKNKNRDYDIIASTTSQVYGGAGIETEKSNQAVDETRGKVLLYNGQLALTYFHANSGGMTEDAKSVWTADIPYLKSVQDDYSIKAPNYSWTLSLSTENIRKALNHKGLQIGSIKRVASVDVSSSGRVQKIKILHGGGEVVVKGTDFRNKIDPTLIKSTLFTITNGDDGILLEGKGYGHGVGMSQWGAYMMACEGYSYSDILKHYYCGTEIR